MAPAPATCARQRGRMNASDASAPSPNAAAKGRRNAENGKSNQSAPKAQATPPDSREGTCWQHILQTLVCYGLIDPELYVFAQSQDRLNKERAMRRRQLKT